MFGKVKNWSWCQSQNLTRRALGFIGRTERLQDYGRPVEGNREEYPVFSPGRRRKEVSGKKTFQLQLLRFDLVVFFELRLLIIVVFLSFSDIFDAMSLVKHSTGETVIQQGKSENALICQDDIFFAGSSTFTPSP